MKCTVLQCKSMDCTVEDQEANNINFFSPSLKTEKKVNKYISLGDNSEKIHHTICGCVFLHFSREFLEVFLTILATIKSIKSLWPAT